MKILPGPLALFTFFAAFGSAHAQTVPGATPAQQIQIQGPARQTTRDLLADVVPQTNPEESALPGVVIEFPTQQPPANSGTLSFVLSDVEIVGPQIVAPEALRSLYADRIGQTITLLQAFEILAEIQAAHRDAGFVFTRVIAPPQEIEGGVFKVQVVEAQIAKVVIEQPEGDIGPVKDLVERIAAKLEGLENPTLAELERTLLLLNDIPGITQATAVPRPGTGLGAVDMYINIVRDPFSGVFFADNRQSPVLGEGIAGISLEASSYLKAGDTTRLSLFTTFGDQLDDLTERNIVQLEHERHLTADGTVLKLRFLGSRNAPGDLLEDLDLEGQQINAEITVEHPVIRTRPLSVWASAGLEYEDSSSEGSETGQTVFDDSVRVLYIGARGLQRDAYGYTSGDVQIRQGLDILGATSGGTDGATTSRFDGQASFTLVRASVEREVIVPKTDGQISVFASALGQYSLDPLLSSQEFAVGGQQIGRAYDPSEYTGDSGFGVLGELRYQIQFEAAGQPIGAQFYGYGDFASVTNKGDNQASEDIASYGGGVRLSLPYDVSLSGEVAIPDRVLQRTDEKKPRFFFNLVKRF